MIKVIQIEKKNIRILKHAGKVRTGYLITRIFSNLDSLSVTLRKINLSIDLRKCTLYFILSTDGACVVAVSISGKQKYTTRLEVTF